MASTERAPQEGKVSLPQSVQDIYTQAATLFPDDFVKQAEIIVAAHRPDGPPESGEFYNLLETYKPFGFVEQDLQPDVLTTGVEHTLAQFSRWRDSNPDIIEAYVSTCQEQLDRARTEYGIRARITRSILSSARETFELARNRRDLEVFGLRNMAETLDPNKIAHFIRETLPYETVLRASLRATDGIPSMLYHQFNIPPDHPIRNELEMRLRHLYHILPERVIQAGAMGKVARTMLGVGAIAAYDNVDISAEEKKEHLARTAYGGLVYGALYAIIDDTLQDAPTNALSQTDRQRYHDVLLEGLRTGKPINTAHLPNHPIATELLSLYQLFTHHFPIEMYPHLYNAAESMYMAQHRDAALTMEEGKIMGVSRLYPDLFTKSAMSRVVANLIARRGVDQDFYRRCINSMFIHQLRDDLIDADVDTREGRVTPFTIPYNPVDANPLYDLFAYDAYIAQTIHPGAEATLAHSQAIFLSHHLSAHPREATALLQKFGDSLTPTLYQFILAASRLPPFTLDRLTTIEQRVKATVGRDMAQRPQTDVDPQIFILDRIDSIDTLIKNYIETREKTESDRELFQIMKYALESGGKHIRASLTLMLAESLGADTTTLTPLVVGVEVFQTASLLLDDLPWQDDSPVRRGKPAAHVVYDAASVELTGVSMMLAAIGVLQELKTQYPTQDIVEVTTYITAVVQDICEGQNQDLHITKIDHQDVSLDAVLEMYHRKTGLPIEASLVPLMILLKRPAEEIAYIKQFAYHAGLVFQIRDDLLDTDHQNKETDGAKEINVVVLNGPENAHQLMEHHLEKAIWSVKQLPFNTNLLQGVVTYFATRTQ